MAHNLKVVGSNPTPATKFFRNNRYLETDLISRDFCVPILVNALSTFDEAPLKQGAFLRLARPKTLWHHRAMIEFRTLSHSHPDLAHSPLLRAALLTLQYAQEHGAISLTKTKAAKRVFFQKAVAHFDWSGR